MFVTWTQAPRLRARVRSTRKRKLAHSCSTRAKIHSLYVRFAPTAALVDAAQRSAALCQYCCKSRFALVIKNSAGRRFGFRVRMRGTSSPHVKRTGDFGNATEAIRIGDQFPSRYFAKNPELCNLRLLQQNLPGGDLS